MRCKCGFAAFDDIHRTSRGDDMPSLRLGFPSVPPSTKKHRQIGGVCLSTVPIAKGSFREFAICRSDTTNNAIYRKRYVNPIRASRFAFSNCFCLLCVFIPLSAKRVQKRRFRQAQKNTAKLAVCVYLLCR